MGKPDSIYVRGGKSKGSIGVIVMLAGGAGFLLSRLFRRDSAAISHLADALVRQTAFSTAGPIIAAAISTTGILFAAVLVPAVVVWVLMKGKNQ